MEVLAAPPYRTLVPTRCWYRLHRLQTRTTADNYANQGSREEDNPQQSVSHRLYQALPLMFGSMPFLHSADLQRCRKSAYGDGRSGALTARLRPKCPVQAKLPRVRVSSHVLLVLGYQVTARP